jgi:hypothetical protein
MKFWIIILIALILIIGGFAIKSIFLRSDDVIKRNVTLDASYFLESNSDKVNCRDKEIPGQNLTIIEECSSQCQGKGYEYTGFECLNNILACNCFGTGLVM